MSEDNELPDRKSLILFGTDVASIPCFRKSFLYGFCGGISGGLAFFLFTSKTKLSCHIGYAAFVTTSLATWMRCRYKYSQDKFSVMQIKEAYKEYMINEGKTNPEGPSITL